MGIGEYYLFGYFNGICVVLIIMDYYFDEFVFVVVDLVWFCEVIWIEGMLIILVNVVWGIIKYC